MDPIAGLPQNPAIGECVVAVIGIETLLSMRRPLTVEQREQITRLPGTIRRSTFRAILSEAIKRPKVPDFDWPTINTLISRAGEGQAEAMVTHLPADIGSVTGGVVARVLDIVHQALPRSVRQSPLFGATASPGSPSAMARFRRLWAVANDPGIVLQLLAANQLDRQSVAWLETLYPGLYQLVVAAAVQCAAQIKARRPRWRPSPTKARQLDVLMQSDSSGGVGDVVGVLYGADRAVAAQGRGGGPALDVRPADYATTTQR